jgi:hypothetical protein
MSFPPADILDGQLGKTADPNKLKEQTRKVKSREAQEDDDIFAVLSTREGRRFLWELLEFCHIDGLSFVDRNHDTTCFNEGMRNVGLKIKARIFRCDPNVFTLMMTEAKKEEEANG